MKDYHIASLFFAFVAGMLLHNGSWFLAGVSVVVALFSFKNVIFE